MFRRKKVHVFSLLTLFILVLLVPTIASAGILDSIFGDSEETAEFLKKYKDYLTYANFMIVLLAQIGWLIIKALYFGTSLMEGLIPESLNLLDFLDTAGVNELTQAIINDLVVVLMAVTLVFLGYKTIIARNPPNFKSVGVNIFISAFLILGMPTLMDTLEELSLGFYNATQTDSDGDVSSTSWSLIKDNTVDLLYVGSQGFSILDEEGSKRNNLSKDNFYITNFDSLLTPDTISDIESEEIKNLEYKLDTDEEGNPVASKVEEGFFSFFSDNFDEGYLRYHTNFFSIIIGLIALLTAYIFTLFIFITTIIEIGIKRIVGLFVFATDLESGQRTKQVVMDICSAFMLIAFTGLMFRFYTMFLTFLGENKPHPMIFIIAIISATFVLIRGSNTVMKYFGIDVGLKDGFAQMAGALGMAKGMSSMVKKAGGAVSNLASKDNQVSGKEKLENNAKEDKKSINDKEEAKGQENKKSLGGLKNSVNGTAGQAFDGNIGAQRELAVAGMAMAGATALNAGQNFAQNPSAKGQSIYSNPNNIQDASQDGVKTTSPQAHKQLNSQNRAVEPNNGSSSSNTLQGKTEQNMSPSRASEVESNNTGSTNHATGTNSNSPTMNGANGKGRTNEEILATMKLQEATMPNKGQDVAANMRVNSNGEIPSGPNKSIRQDVSNTGSNNTTDSIQRVSRQMEGTPVSNVGATRQSITQDVQQSSNGANDIKQKVIQESQKSTSVASEQVQQKVVQDIQKSSSTAPEQATQRVIQDVQRATTVAPEQIQQKIVQDIQKATSVAPEQLTQRVTQDVQRTAGEPNTLTQKVVQDIQKSDGSPEKRIQNIKQVVQTASSNITPATQQVTKKVNFEERLKNFENRQQKAPSRFDFINNK
ncbi:hypothetical protein QP810_10880 [Streptococcus agalactiae]|uniref:pLS20_p028 family conjugation system transmembrane protein n=1 Tax=Streptococcus agalactiae TaxID=1311 RepID=UPI0025524036|nr:hypothetical protein [Streptococcus agalactiae]MDK8747720.1 hypothetical protein [Streptococcus agalactiae]